MNSSELAAWVQAVGSLAAIGFAWWQGSRASREQRQAESERLKGRLAAFIQLSESCSEMLRKSAKLAAKDAVEYWHTEFSQAAFDVRVKAVEDLRLTDFADSVVCVRALEIQGAMREARDVVHRAPWPETREWVDGMRPVAVPLVLSHNAKIIEQAVAVLKAKL